MLLNKIHVIFSIDAIEKMENQFDIAVGDELLDIVAKVMITYPVWSIK